MDEQGVTVKSQASAIPRKSVIQGYTVFWNPSTKTVSVTRGGDSEEAAIEQARLGVVNLKSFRLAADRLIDRIDNVTEESQDDRNARIIAGEIEDAMSQGNEKLAQEKTKELKKLGYYFDKQGRLQAMGMYETALNPRDPKADLDAKRKALQDLSMNKDVDQKAVQQRKLDLDKEAKDKGLDEGWSDRYVAQRTGRPRTPYSVYINGKKWKDFANDDHARAVMDKLKAKFKADGRDPSVITIAPTDMSESAAEEQKPAGWGEFPPKQEITIVPPKKLKSGQTYQDQNKYWQSQGQAPIYKTNEEKEPTTRQELLNRVDKIQRMMTQERNPSNLQILRKELEMLKQRYQHLREVKDTEAVEQAIVKRIMVAHRDMLVKFGPEKIINVAEDVAYNVGDIGEMGSNDISGWVKQVQQILGANA
jgi:hypothetical protein